MVFSRHRYFPQVSGIPDPIDMNAEYKLAETYRRLGQQKTPAVAQERLAIAVHEGLEGPLVTHPRERDQALVGLGGQ